MIVAADLPAAVGNTPLIRLRRASEETGCEIWGKAEFMNPGQSVKDRAALWIIRDAVAKGALRPGGTIVEGTAGNTGIGLALIGAAMGFRTVIVIPDTQSQEKKDMIRLAGAELVEVPAVPYRNPDNYVRYSGRLAEKLAASDPNGAVWANQFDNVANRQAHVDGTAPEIWEQTGGRIDGFICAVGSGGTLAGVAEGLRAREAGGADRPRRSLRRGALALLRPRQPEGRGRLDHRGDRPGADHRQPRGAGRRHALPHPGRGGGRAGLRPAARGGALPRRLLGDERGGRGAHGAGPRPGASDRDRALRRRHPLSVEALQPGLPARRRACRCPAGWSGRAATFPMPGRTDARRLRRRSCAPWRCSPSSCWPGRPPARASDARGPGRRLRRRRGSTR